MTATITISVARQSLQDRVDDELQRLGVTTISGEQEIDGPLWIRHTGRVIFESATLRPTVVWSPVDAVLVVTGVDVVLEGLVEIDERGYYRVGSNAVGQSVLFTNIENFDASRLHVRCRDTGIATAMSTIEPVRTIIERNYEDTLENLFDETDLPSGPDVLFVALDLAGDFYDVGTYLGQIGPCRVGEIGHLELTRDERTKRSFGIRFATNQTLNRPYDDYENPCEDITVRRTTIVGEYTLNAMQMRGTGTRNIQWIDAHVNGKSVGAWHCDKGVSRSGARRILVENGGMPDYYLGNPSFKWFAASIQGSSPSQTCDDCFVDELIVRSCSSSTVDDLECGLFLQYAVNPRIGSVDVSDLNAGLHGVGVLLAFGASDVRIDSVRTKNVLGGVQIDPSQGVGNVWIGHLDIQATRFGGYFSVGAASGRVQIGDGRVLIMQAVGDGTPLMSFAGDLERVSMGAVHVGGGGSGAMGIFAGCPLLLVGTKINTVAIGLQAIGVAAKVRAVGVDASTCATPLSIGGGTVVGAGNSWQDP